ncbi:type II toxin-antitoxin system VapC family toxin [candidate division KSB1 bacterium]|nr:type II toxin-antitoxin system VapC family toxin [candidate division KSB1 bacterium]
MYGLDTNVLVRYIVQDEPRQSRAATEFIERHLTVEKPGYINAVVLCELVWVLKRAYHYDKPLLSAIIQQILNTKELIIEHADRARQALDFYRHGEADFSDYYIAAINRSVGCRKTVTFDKLAATHSEFRLIGT